MNANYIISTSPYSTCRERTMATQWPSLGWHNNATNIVEHFYEDDLVLCFLYAGFHTCKSADATFLPAPCLNPQCHSLHLQQLAYLATQPPPWLPAGWECDVATSPLHKFAPSKIINTHYNALRSIEQVQWRRQMFGFLVRCLFL